LKRFGVGNVSLVTFVCVATTSFLLGKAIFRENGGFFSCEYTIILLLIASAFRRFDAFASSRDDEKNERGRSDGETLSFVEV